MVEPVANSRVKYAASGSLYEFSISQNTEIVYGCLLVMREGRDRLNMT
jgi:hypothetical protein